MKHELIKTENYLLVVSDEYILSNTYLLNNNQVHFCVSCSEDFIHLKGDFDSPFRENCKKIIAHLPLNGAPHLDGVDVLPKIENEVEVMEVFNMACDLLLEVMSKNPPPSEEAILRTNQIKELNQPKLPIAFDSHTQRFADKNNILKQWDGPRTITNSEGKTEWVGKYLFK